MTSIYHRILSVSGINHFYWAQPISWPRRVTKYGKMQSIWKASYETFHVDVKYTKRKEKQYGKINHSLFFFHKSLEVEETSHFSNSQGPTVIWLSFLFSVITLLSFPSHESILNYGSNLCPICAGLKQTFCVQKLSSKREILEKP